jgi:ATP-binding cassette subfamily B protein
MTHDQETLYATAWTTAQLGEALELVARRAHLANQPLEAPHPPDNLARADEETLDRWVMLAAGSLGIEAEPVMTSFADLADLARRAAPAILRLPPRDAQDDPRFIALVQGGARPALLGADSRVRRVDALGIGDALSTPLVASYLPMADLVLDAAGVPSARRSHARTAIVAQQMSNQPMLSGWLLRLSPSASLWQQAQHNRLWLPILLLLAAQILQLILLVVAWWFIGRVTFTGEYTPVWLQAWALVLFTGIPVQLLMNSAQSRYAVGLGTLFRQRLLYGTLKLQPDEIRHQGMGQFLERVMMSEQVETLAVGGGLMALLTVFQLGTAVWTLSIGAGGMISALTLAAFILLLIGAGWQYYRTNHVWVSTYRQMTNDLVERMVGHRTRLAQQDPREWHTPEDAELERYLDLSTHFDRWGVTIEALPSLWVVVGLAGLSLAFASGSVTTPGLAISLGGILLAFNALTTIVAGLSSMANVALAWEQVGPIFRAAAHYTLPSPTALSQTIQEPPSADRAEPILRARNLTFRYREHGTPVLRDVNLDIYAGDRLLLEGPSGGGKTTLAAVLAGLRAPEAGLVLLRGYDRPALDSDVTPRRIVMAPQFHENHIFTATLGFNLLMGRRWPPRPEDLAEAEALCRELGLEELLARMPSGMQQMVGESGWQLSHGERSRVFIARVLLQQAHLFVLDESFGALDPENLRRALQCALDRAKTLLVIAHP